MLAQRISMVSGVAQVQVFGAQKYAVRVQVDPDQLRGAAASASTKSTRRCQNWNVNLPTGSCSARTRRFNIKASGQLMNAEQFQPIVVAYRNGAPVRLEQVADVIDSVEERRTSRWFYTSDGGSARSSCAIQRQPGTNTIEVIDAVRKLLPAVQRAAAAVGPPRSCAYDRSQTDPRVVPRHPVHAAAHARRSWSW